MVPLRTKTETRGAQVVLDAEGTTVLGVELLYETEVVEIDHGLLRLGVLGLQTTRVLVDGVTRGKMIVMHGSVPHLDVVSSECLCRDGSPASFLSNTATEPVSMYVRSRPESC